MALKGRITLRAVAIGVTILEMVMHYFLPPKNIVLHPSALNNFTIYADGDWGGESTVKWENQAATRWRCQLLRSPAHPVCGISLHWNDTERGPINAEGYDRLRLTLKYEGAGHTLRIYMRNFDSEHGVLDDRDTHKFMYANIPAADFGNFQTSIVTTLPLNELQVADWWKEEFNIDRNNARPQFDNVTSLGIDFPFPQVMGDHRLELERAELVGEWISAENFYLGIILTWLVGLFIETLFNMYRWRTLARENLRQVKDLKNYAKQLRVKSEKYRELSHIDPLTGVYNRYGFMQTLKELFGRRSLSGCLLIVDIDHFKSINDNFGHVVGDRALASIAQLLLKNVRKDDIFARWGGEEFVVLVTDYDLAQAQALAEKLRSLVEKSAFEGSKGLNLSISIGLTSFSKTDSLNSAFIRADEALYMAKTQGRNQVVAAAS